MTRLTWQEYYEQVLRVRLRDLATSQTSGGRELIERLQAIAADYKRFMFGDDFACQTCTDEGFGQRAVFARAARRRAFGCEPTNNRA